MTTFLLGREKRRSNNWTLKRVIYCFRLVEIFLHKCEFFFTNKRKRAMLQCFVKMTGYS